MGKALQIKGEIPLLKDLQLVSPLSYTYPICKTAAEIHQYSGRKNPEKSTELMIFLNIRMMPGKFLCMFSVTVTDGKRLGLSIAFCQQHDRRTCIVPRYPTTNVIHVV